MGNVPAAVAAGESCRHVLCRPLPAAAHRQQHHHSCFKPAHVSNSPAARCPARQRRSLVPLRNWHGAPECKQVATKCCKLGPRPQLCSPQQPAPPLLGTGCINPQCEICPRRRWLLAATLPCSAQSSYGATEAHPSSTTNRNTGAPVKTARRLFANRRDSTALIADMPRLLTPCVKTQHETRATTHDQCRCRCSSKFGSCQIHHALPQYPNCAVHHMCSHCQARTRHTPACVVTSPLRSSYS